MKQKQLSKSFCLLPILMLLAAATILVGCSKDDDEDKNDDPWASAQRIDTYAIEPCFVYGEYVVNHPNAHPYVENTWGENGSSFDVFILQGNMFTSIGQLLTKERTIASSDRKKAVHLEVPIPAGINTNMPYQVVALCAPGSIELRNGNIVNTMEIKRGDLYCGSWYVMQGGSGTSSRSSYLTTMEVLYITNKTSQPIKVKHKGVDAKEKWYYSKATASITPSLTVVANGLSSNGDAESPEVEIEAGKEGWIEAIYIPNGKKMTDASIILEIDGKDVRTSPISSSVSIENGIPCFMSVKWDGKSLEWN